MRHFHILIALLVGLTSPAVAQENNTNKYSIDGKHRGLDFSISAGYMVLETQRDQLFCLSKLVLANSFILIYM